MNDPLERRGRLRAACLAVLGGMLACSAPDIPSGPPPAAVLRIPGAPQVSLKVGAVVQLSVVAVNVQGAEVRVPGTWSSSDTSVARVDDPGFVHAVGYGEATITVYHGGGSAAVLVSTQPSGLRVRQLFSDVTVEAGDAAAVVAEFLDSNGAVIAVPWDVYWEASAGARLAPGGGRQTQLLRELPAGEIEVNATSGPFRARARLSVRPRAVPQLTVPTFTMWVDALPNGRMRFQPDLVVVAPFGATMQRLDFKQAPKSLCANVPLSPGAVTPLFDFIPYDVSWQEPAVPLGTAVEVHINIQRADGSPQTVRALGLVTAREGVIDYGLGNYPWVFC